MPNLSIFLHSGVTGNPSQPGLSQVYCHKWLLRSNGKESVRSRDLRTTVILRGKNRISTPPAGCHLPLHTDIKIWCNVLAQTGFVLDLSDGCDIKTCSTLWVGQQKKSSLHWHSPAEALPIHMEILEGCQEKMKVLATTFILTAPQCMPSCAVEGCQNYSLLFQFKDKKVTSS